MFEQTEADFRLLEDRRDLLLVWEDESRVEDDPDDMEEDE